MFHPIENCCSQAFNDPKWRSQVNRLTAIILESIDQYGWLCGVPLGVETPGLMTELAGIGYGLLRLAEPSNIASVLTLAPPTSNQVRDIVLARLLQITKRKMLKYIFLSFAFRLF